MANQLTDRLVSVEIWGGDALNDWQDYDCPPEKKGDTVDSYAEWCIGEESEYWATVNSADDKIRLNGWYVVDGADHYTADGEHKERT